MDYASYVMASAKHLIRCLPVWALLAAPILSGCLATYSGDQPSAAEVALREDIQMMYEENRRLKGRIEAFDLEIERLSRTVEMLRAAPGAPSLADMQSLQQRIAALETHLRNLDAARERDRKEIIETLTARLSQMMSATSAAARPRASTPPAQTTRRTGPQEGYEHIVEAGQSLSAIAAAYGVSVKAITDANNITNPNALRVGQKLFIPAN